MKLEPSPPSQIGCFTGAVFLGGLVAAIMIPPARRVAAEIGCGNPMLSAFVCVLGSLVWGAVLGAIAGQKGSVMAGLWLGGLTALVPLAIVDAFDAEWSTMIGIMLAHLACGLMCGYLGGRQPQPQLCGPHGSENPPDMHQGNRQ